MKTRDLVRGSILVAAAVALLYSGAAVPWAGVVTCILAGTTSVVPLLHPPGQFRTAVLLYLSVSTLAALVVPRKGIVLGYMGICGLYPILKYGIESRVPHYLQLISKGLYAAFVVWLGDLLVSYGIAFQPAWFSAGRGVVLGIAWILLAVYDRALSQWMVLLRRLLPPRK